MQSNYPADKRYPRFTFIQLSSRAVLILFVFLHDTPWHKYCPDMLSKTIVFCRILCILTQKKRLLYWRFELRTVLLGLKLLTFKYCITSCNN